MIPFIAFTEKDENDSIRYFVLQKDFPHFVGEILSHPKEGTWQSPIGGYNLWVVFSGTLQGRLIPSYRNISDEMQSVFDNMAVWYLANKIIPNKSKYKKFKINV